MWLDRRYQAACHKAAVLSDQLQLACLQFGLELSPGIKASTTGDLEVVGQPVVKLLSCDCCCRDFQ